MRSSPPALQKHSPTSFSKISSLVISGWCLILLGIVLYVRATRKPHIQLRKGIAKESLDARRLRLAIEASSGWWLERIRFPDKEFYSFTWMVFDGNTFTKNGINFDPNGSMDGTTYSGQLVTSLFPTLLSIYSNDLHSHEYYTEGIFSIEMQLDPTGEYNQYKGSCYDKLGRRDQITGQKLNETLSLAELQRMSDDQKLSIVSKHFQTDDGTAHDAKGVSTPEAK